MIDPEKLHPFKEYQARITRRNFFGKMAQGIGVAALGSMLNPLPSFGSATSTNALASSGVGLPHYAPKA